MYDSEDSDWDYPYEIASAGYVDDYNFDVPYMYMIVHVGLDLYLLVDFSTVAGKSIFIYKRGK